ncbi:MAG: MarR family winged helix-turn-helix transcriptional regulator [Bacteroidota bacterium]
MDSPHTLPYGFAPGAATHLALQLAARRAERASRPLAEALGISYDAYLMLSWLWAADGADERKMVHALQADTDVVGALVAKGYVERSEGSPETRCIWLTAAGRAARYQTAAYAHRGDFDAHAAVPATHYLLDVLAYSTP